MQSENGNLVSIKTALDTENEALKVLSYPQQASVLDNARALVQEVSQDLALSLSLSVCIRVLVWINMIVHACIHFFACVHASVGVGGVIARQWVIALWAHQNTGTGARIGVSSERCDDLQSALGGSGGEAQCRASDIDVGV